MNCEISVQIFADSNASALAHSDHCALLWGCFCGAAERENCQLSRRRKAGGAHWVSAVRYARNSVYETIKQSNIQDGTVVVEEAGPASRLGTETSATLRERRSSSVEPRAEGTWYGELPRADGRAAGLGAPLPLRPLLLLRESNAKEGLDSLLTDAARRHTIIEEVTSN